MKTQKVASCKPSIAESWNAAASREMCRCRLHETHNGVRCVAVAHRGVHVCIVRCSGSAAIRQADRLSSRPRKWNKPCRPRAMASASLISEDVGDRIGWLLGPVGPDAQSERDSFRETITSDYDTVGYG